MSGSGFIVTATGLGGEVFTFDRILSLAVNDALASPAMAASCRVLVDESAPELMTLAVSRDGLTLFQGRIDRQLATLSGKGRVLQLEARSKGALLLDNEAEPCELTNVGLANAWRLFLEPYGFQLGEPGDGRAISFFAVRKGQSEWGAFAAFVARAYGSAPSLRGELVYIRPPRAVAGGLSVGKGGYPFTSLEQEFLSYQIVSEVIIRDEYGNYSRVVKNPDAAYYQARRKRYVIPPAEFADAVGLDANQRIQSSMRGKERITVTLPLYVRANPGEAVKITGEDFTLQDLVLDEITWSFGETGFFTELGVVRRTHYN